MFVKKKKKISSCISCSKEQAHCGDRSTVTLKQSHLPAAVTQAEGNQGFFLSPIWVKSHLITVHAILMQPRVQPLVNRNYPTKLFVAGTTFLVYFVFFISNKKVQIYIFNFSPIIILLHSVLFSSHLVLVCYLLLYFFILFYFSCDKNIYLMEAYKRVNTVNDIQMEINPVWKV